MVRLGLNRRARCNGTIWTLNLKIEILSNTTTVKMWHTFLWRLLGQRVKCCSSEVFPLSAVSSTFIKWLWYKNKINQMWKIMWNPGSAWFKNIWGRVMHRNTNRWGTNWSGWGRMLHFSLTKIQCFMLPRSCYGVCEIWDFRFWRESHTADSSLSRSRSRLVSVKILYTYKE